MKDFTNKNSFFVSFKGGWKDGDNTSDANEIIVDVNAQVAIGQSDSGKTMARLTFSKKLNKWQLQIGYPNDSGELHLVWAGVNKSADGVYQTSFCDPSSSITDVIVF